MQPARIDEAWPPGEQYIAGEWVVINMAMRILLNLEI
jgi:hypothetical protein